MRCVAGWWHREKKEEKKKRRKEEKKKRRKKKGKKKKENSNKKENFFKKILTNKIKKCNKRDTQKIFASQAYYLAAIYITIPAFFRRTAVWLKTPEFIF